MVAILVRGSGKEEIELSMLAEPQIHISLFKGLQMLGMNSFFIQTNNAAKLVNKVSSVVQNHSHRRRKPPLGITDRYFSGRLVQRRQVITPSESCLKSEYMGYYMHVHQKLMKMEQYNLRGRFERTHR